MANEPQPTTGTVSRRMDAFHKRMLDRANLTTDRGAEVMAAQVEKILGAQTVEQIWNADTGGTIQARDVPGTVWEIRSFEPVLSNRTDIENTHGYYVSTDATYLGGPKDVATANGLVPGQDYALQTGAELIVTKLAMFEAAKALPIRAMILGIKTGAGRTVIKLTEPPEMVTQASAE